MPKRAILHVASDNTSVSKATKMEGDGMASKHWLHWLCRVASQVR